jgi:WD40 repeat protein
MHPQHALYLALLVIGMTGAPLRAAFMTGDVFVSAGLIFSGAYRYSSSGTYLETLGSDTQMGGGAFDRAGNFYLTTFFTNQVIKFDNGPEPPPGHLGAIGGSTYLRQLKFPIAATFDAAGNLYIAQEVNGAPIVEYAPNGTLLRSLPTVPSANTRDLKISPDEKTLYYSTGSSIKRIDLATAQPLSDFANVGGIALEFQLLPDGGMLVANGSEVVRLDRTGKIVQTYSVPAANEIYSVALTPDNQHFWTEGYGETRAVQFDLVSGAEVSSFNTPLFVVSLAVYNPASFGAGPITSIPEPGSISLMALSLFVLAGAAIRRKTRLDRLAVGH